MKATDASSYPLSIIVIGASGDLALKKIFPALFALYCQGHLPEHVHLYGFARTPLTDDAFRARMAEHLTCRYMPGTRRDALMEAFLRRCAYVAGEYGSRDAYLDLYTRMRLDEGDGPAQRLYYLSIPPFLFVEVARALAGAGLIHCGPGEGWSRAVIEKPFGRDRASSDALTADLNLVFTEDQIYRIDHYLGKEVIQNLLILRFANRVFEPIWNAEHIDHVRIAWREDIGVAMRAGYFDQYGIVRDVIQNHLLQILALTAMEPPVRVDAHAVRNEKVRLLRTIPPIASDRLVLGQYTQGMLGKQMHLGYLEESGIPPASCTPTFAAALLQIENDRWRGTPFLISAGKGLATRETEIRIRFKPARSVPVPSIWGALDPNELIIRVQPREAIVLRVINKHPGLELSLTPSNLDLHYAEAFRAEIPDAYECLLLDVLQGDRSLFIRADELEAAWDIFTPVLHEIEAAPAKPASYAFGSEGPVEALSLAKQFGIDAAS